MSERRTVAVVGGGMLGVSLARALAAAGRDVTLFEAGPTLGGLAAAWDVAGLTCDRYYHVTLGSDVHTRELLDAVGIGSELQLRTTSTGYWDGSRVHPAASVADFLRLPGLSLVAKLRIGATIALNARRRDWRRIEQQEVEPWLRRWSGRAATDRFWRAQLRAKLGDDHRDVAATLLWATFRRLDGARRGAGRTEQMGYVRGGYARTIAAVDAHLRSIGVDVRVETPVHAVAVDGARAMVGHSGGTDSFDDVVLTLAAPLVASLVAPMAPAAAERFAAVRTMGVICATVVLDRPVSQHYLTYLAAPSPLTAVVDMSALVDGSDLAGRGLVYLPRYLGSDDPAFDRPDAELLDEWATALRRVHPDVTPERILGSAVARSRHVFAVPGVGYSERVPPLTVAPGLHAVSSAHLVHATLNVDETVALGTWACAELVARGRLDVDRLLARP